MVQKKGLGRGLGSLFSDFDENDNFSIISNIDKDEVKKETQEISLAKIDRNINQPRKKFDEKSLNELAESIKTHGVVQPIILTERNGRYLIVAGERRFRAAKIAGLTTIPALVRNYTDKDIAEISIIENLQREDLNPIESAKAIQELIDKFNLTQEEVADKIGKSRPAVANTLRLLNLAPEVIKLVEDGKLSAGHARTLLPVDDKYIQLELAKLACDNKITVRELEKYIKDYQNPKTKKQKEVSQSLEIKEFTKKLQNIFSTKVSIQGNDKKGKICINYYNKDDLDRIYSLINKI